MSMHALMIQQQPPAIWYKDGPGGKSNFMTMKITLTNAHKLPPDVVIKLQADLFYESGQRVEEKYQYKSSDSMVNFERRYEYDPPAVSRNSQTATIKVRLERVSYRFNQQRFMFRIYPWQDYGLNIQPVYTTAIDSKSKAKKKKKKKLAGAGAGAGAGRGRKNPLAGVDLSGISDGSAATALKTLQDDLVSRIDGGFKTTNDAIWGTINVLQQVVHRLGAIEDVVHAFNGDAGGGGGGAGAGAGAGAGLEAPDGMMPVASDGGASLGGGGGGGNGSGNGAGAAPGGAAPRTIAVGNAAANRAAMAPAGGGGGGGGGGAGAAPLALPGFIRAFSRTFAATTGTEVAPLPALGRDVSIPPIDFLGPPVANRRQQSLDAFNNIARVTTTDLTDFLQTQASTLKGVAEDGAGGGAGAGDDSDDEVAPQPTKRQRTEK